MTNFSNKYFFCFNQGYISNNFFKGNSNSEFDEIFNILNFLRSLIKEIIKLRLFNYIIATILV